MAMMEKVALASESLGRRPYLRSSLQPMYGHPEQLGDFRILRRRLAAAAWGWSTRPSSSPSAATWR